MATSYDPVPSPTSSGAIELTDVRMDPSHPRFKKDDCGSPGCTEIKTLLMHSDAGGAGGGHNQVFSREALEQLVVSNTKAMQSLVKTLSNRLTVATQRRANPAPLGLAGFALTTWFLSGINTEEHTFPAGSYANGVLGMAWFYGGFVQFLGGQWEFICNSTFPGVTFSSFGGFWMSFALLRYIILPDWAAKGLSAGEKNQGVGLFLCGWTIFVAILTFCSFRTNLALIFTFVTVFLALLSLTIGTWANSDPTHIAGGWFGLMGASGAFYVCSAHLINNAYKRQIVPLGHYAWITPHPPQAPPVEQQPRTIEELISDLDAKLQHPHLRKVNPGPLGLASFALTTWVLSVMNIEIGISTRCQSAVLPLALMYGGFMQIVAGMWEFIVDSMFAGVVFTSFGAFWMSFAAFSWPTYGLMVTNKWSTDDANQILGIYLMVWCIFIAVLMIASYRVSRSIFITFIFVFLCVLFLAVGKWTGSNFTHRAGGWFGVICACGAWYCCAGQLIVDTWKRELLPLGHLAPPPVKASVVSSKAGAV